MKVINSILVPTDFSEVSSRALSYAIWFADRMGATIDLLHVVYPGTDVMDFPSLAAQVTMTQVENAQAVMQAFTAEALTRVQSMSDLKEVPLIRPKVEVGAPVALIAGVAKDLGSDLIVIGVRGEHNALEVAFGSITTGVLRKAEAPVLVVPPEVAGLKIHNVGYAVSLDESDPYHIWEAAQMLAPFNAFLRIVHVRSSQDTQKSIDLEKLESFLGNKSLALQVSYHESTNPDTEEGLEDFVSLHKIDLLVMYSPKRAFLERLGHRSLTRRLALYADVPLLVMK